eukprot:tig00000381_g24544.t1
MINQFAGGIMLDQQHFVFQHRGTAFFASYMLQPWGYLHASLRLCRVGGNVDLPLDLRLPLKAGMTNDGVAVYLMEGFPGNFGTQGLEPYQVASPVVIQVRVSRLLNRDCEADGWGSSACEASVPGFYASGYVCPWNITYTTAIYSWAVDTTTSPVSAILMRSPVVIRHDELPFMWQYIVANERPGVAGQGIGALEGKWVQSLRYDYYVLGDEIVRYRFVIAAACDFICAFKYR